MGANDLNIISVQHHTQEFWNRLKGSAAFYFWSVFLQFVFANIGKGHFEIPKTWFNDGTMKWVTDAIANTASTLLM
jgi:hypothetical protein